MTEEIQVDNIAEEQPAAQVEQVQEPATKEQVETEQATGNTIKRTGKLSKRDQKLLEQIERLKQRQQAMEIKHKIREEKETHAKIKKAIRKERPTGLFPSFKQGLSNPYHERDEPISHQFFNELKARTLKLIEAK